MSRPIASNTDPVVRNKKLPLQIVHFPTSSIPFIGFKRRRHESLYFCSCAETALENYIQHRINSLDNSHREITVENVIQLFQEDIRDNALNSNIDDLENLINIFQFKKDICHCCNQVVPKYRYCHQMYGTVFKQNYGWYIKQRQYKYGFYANIKAQAPLINKVPEEIMDIIDDELAMSFNSKIERLDDLQNKRKKRNKEIKKERDEKIQEYLDKGIEELTLEERSGNYVYQIKQKYKQKPRLPPRKKEKLEELKELFESNWERITDYIENEVRMDFGHYEKGNRWTSETILYQLVESEYSHEYTIKRHHRPDWLDNLELDIYIEEAGVGIEYQGIQHYEAIEHWGGEEALKERQERDQRKKNLCDKHDIELVEVRHDEDISEELIQKRIDPLL